MTMEGIEPIENSEKEHLIKKLISDAENLGFYDIASLAQDKIDSKHNSSKSEKESEEQGTDDCGIIEQYANVESISVTPIEEYLQTIQEYPIADHSAESSGLETLLKEQEANKRNALMFDKFIENGLVEEIGYFPNQEKEMSESTYIENVQNGFKVRSIPIFENAEIIGHRYYRDIKNISIEQEEKKKAIESEYASEASNSWFYREQEKEKLLNQKVVSGEMVYLGTVSTDEHISLAKKGLPAKSSEEVIVFDSQKKATDRIRLYAYI